MTKVFWNSSFAIAYTIPLKYVGNTLYARNAAGLVVAASTLDSSAIQAAAIAVSSGTFLGTSTQMYELNLSSLSPALPAGTWFFPGYASQPSTIDGWVGLTSHNPAPWNGAAIVDAGTLQLVTLPLSVTVEDGEIESVTLYAYQYSAYSFTFVIVDSSGAAVDLSGKSISFSVYSLPGNDNEYVLTSGGGEITIGGDDDNQLAVATDDSNTETAGDYRYVLRNETDDVVLARGVLLVVAENDSA